MTEFEQSRWADKEFSQNYRNDADVFLPYRSLFIETAISIYRHFINSRQDTRILDLGCGDGLFIQELLKSFSPLKVTLVDGAKEMLDAARKRLGNQKKLDFIQVSFQELLNNEPLSENFDFIYSSLAIHHLPFEDKKNLYLYIHRHLSPGGYFIHYDVVEPPSLDLENWYLSVWRQWIETHSLESNREKLLEVPGEYKGNPDNVPDTLESQLLALKEIGFNNVDCFLKYGIFALFGGSRYTDKHRF